MAPSLNNVNVKESDEINDKKSAKPGKLPIKVYEPRNSILTDLFIEDKHVKSVYNLGIALFVGTVLSSAAVDYVNSGWVYLGFRTINVAFRNFKYVVFIWTILFLSSLTVYYGFIIWAKMRKQLQNQRKLWDLLWLTLFISYYPGVLYFASRTALTYDLGIASSLTVVMEATRFLMKVHAFVRTSSARHFKETEDTLYPTFSHYLYFSFAPVAIYRDTYPRSYSPIRWHYVGRHLLELILGIIFYAIVFEKTFTYGLSDYGIKTYTWKDIVAFILQNFYAGIILSLLFFYCGLHCYLNATAEILGFSDRLFYKDWWTADTPESCLRRWNVLIHDWLYTYIYKDLNENVFQNNKKMSKYIVFLISAVFHDYIVCVSGQLFIPITSMLYLIPVILMEFQYINKQTLGVVMWIGFGITISANFTILSIEYYARINCPLYEASFYDYLKPRIVYC